MKLKLIVGMMLTLLLTGMLTLSLDIQPVSPELAIEFQRPYPSAGETSWLSGWSYRAKCTITNSTGAGSNYTICFNVYRGNGTNSGNSIYLNGHNSSTFPNDLNFTDDDGTTPLDYWIEDSNSSWAKVWVKVADDLSSNNATIYCYYGKSGMSSSSNGAETFPFFDDFLERTMVNETYDNISPSNIVELSDGTLLTTIMTRKYNTKWDTVLYKSIDGDTWTFVSDIFVSSRQLYNEATLQLLDNGELLCFTPDNDDQKIYMKKSTDNGLSWSSAITVLAGTYLGGCTSVQLSNGRILCAIPEFKNSTTIIRKSDDNGRTWSTLSTTQWTTPYRNEDPDMIVLPNGDILLSTEEEQAEGGIAKIYCKRSTDNGATWGSKVAIAVSNYDNDGGRFIQKTPDELWFAWATDEDAGGGTYGKSKIKIAKSFDNGNSWGNVVVARWLLGEGVRGVRALLKSDHLMLFWDSYKVTSPAICKQMRWYYQDAPWTRWDYGTGSSGGQIDIEDGIIRLKSNSTSGRTAIYSTNEWNYQKAMRFRFQFGAGAANYPHKWIGWVNENNPTGNQNKLLGCFYQRKDDSVLHTITGNDTHFDLHDWDGAYTGWNTFEVRRKASTGYEYVINDVSKGNSTKYTNTDRKAVIMSYQAIGHVKCDWILVRKYVYPEPSPRWGSEEMEAPPALPPPTAPVGGIYIPVNKLELLAPYIGLTIPLAVAIITLVFIKRKRKKRLEISSIIRVNSIDRRIFVRGF